MCEQGRPVLSPAASSRSLFPLSFALRAKLARRWQAQRGRLKPAGSNRLAQTGQLFGSSRPALRCRLCLACASGRAALVTGGSCHSLVRARV